MPDKTLICLGGAETVWTDYDKASHLCPDHDVAAVNEAARDFPGRLSLFCSLHQEKIGNWQRQRKNAGRNDDYLTISHQGHADSRIDHIVREYWAGSSGLYVCQVGLLFCNYPRVIVCGVPMDARPHYHSPGNWEHCRHYQRWWKEATSQKHMIDRIRSMSGWTRDLLGSPTTTWLNS